MATTAQLVREWRGPAVLGFGFRPFYLLGAIWAALSMAWWIAALAGRAPTPALYAPGDWHGHALLFGYTSAAITGFILTAVPNWTGRLPVVGWRLGALVLLWLAGRAGMSLPLPQVLAAALDLALPTVLIAVLAREIIAGKNWRNLPVLGLIAGFAAAQALFHAGAPQLALRAGIGIAVLLITLIGGRIIPSFTRNWLVRQGEKALPAPPMARFDLGVLGLSILALAGFIAGPLSMPTALLCALAGAAHLARLSRWRGAATWPEKLLFVLHLAYFWIAAGFFAVAAAAMGWLPEAGARHVWLAGGIGTITLAVMARSALGHTGRELAADRGQVAIFAAVQIAAIARLAAMIWPGAPLLLQLAGIAWIAAFAGFALWFWPVLTGPRVSLQRSTARPR